MCERKPIGRYTEEESTLILPLQRREVYVPSMRQHRWIAGFDAKPFFHQTVRSNATGCALFVQLRQLTFCVC